MHGPDYLTLIESHSTAGEIASSAVTSPNSVHVEHSGKGQRHYIKSTHNYKLARTHNKGLCECGGRVRLRACGEKTSSRIGSEIGHEALFTSHAQDIS